MSKLSQMQREEIMAAYAVGNISHAKLAARYGVHENTIRRIVNPKERAAAKQNAKNWRERNPEKVQAYVAAYWPEWYAQNAERLVLRAKAWREANPERHAELQRRWSQAHPEAVARYRANSLAAPGCGWEPEQWQLVCETAWGGACAYCGDAIPTTIDHVVPLSRDGSHYPENLVPACKPCNSSKGAKLLSEWRDGAHVWVEEFAREVARIMSEEK